MGEKRVEKRNRPPASCDPCRTSKLKCDRGYPCNTCLRRAPGVVCHYAPNANRNRTQTQRGAIEKRLKKVEGLIATLVSTEAPELSDNVPRSPLLTPSSPVVSGPQHSHEQNVPPRVQERSKNQRIASQTGYVEQSHWSSILHRIQELRVDIAASPGDVLTPDTELPLHSLTSTSKNDTVVIDASDSQTEVFDMAFGPTPKLTLPEILDALPERQVCDGLLSRYFNSPVHVFSAIHPAKFQREYEAFWESPHSTSLVWISLLFAILNFSVSVQQLSGTKAPADIMIPTSQELSRKTEQCLILGDYANATEYGIESLVLHGLAQFLLTKDTDSKWWFLLGIVTRMAIRMGYHRDPSKLPPSSNISPFAGEMRRRVWAHVFQIDALFSFQIGLPSMIPTENCDTELPRNLEFDDFSPEMEELPPPRPLSQQTSATYTIVKNPVMVMFKRIVQHDQALTPQSYEATMALDAECRSTYNDLPRNFQYKPISQCFTDNPAIIMNRTTIEIVFLKGLVILHRRFSSKQHSLNQEQSRQLCITAALTLLQRQADLHEATQPGGFLGHEKWMVNAITANDFIFAAIVVCLDLTLYVRYALAAVQGETARHRRITPTELDQEMTAIGKAQKIWDVAAEVSAEARVASRALSSTMQKVRDHQMRSMQGTPSTQPQDCNETTGEIVGETEQLSGLSPKMADGSEWIDWVSSLIRVKPPCLTLSH